MRVFCLLVYAFIHCSCVTGQMDPFTEIECESLRTFYVVNHGWHTGIVINGADFTEAVPALEMDFNGSKDYLEIGWGDERFYQAQTPTLGLAIQAMLWPTPTVMHIVAVPDLPQRYFSVSEVLELSVPQSGYEKMLAFIAESFDPAVDNGIIKLGHGLYGNSRFYRAKGEFHAFNTCNTWVAKAIESSGFPIGDTNITTAEALLSRIHRSAGTYKKCFSVH
jgi:uncharacterized protein (TIGR02117 family)